MFNNQQACVDVSCFEVQAKDYKIQLWGKNDYSPREFFLQELRMTFPSYKAAEDFAYTLRRHYDYPTDWCWVVIVRVE